VVDGRFWVQEKGVVGGEFLDLEREVGGWGLPGLRRWDFGRGLLSLGKGN
jgi:hypothetical protein